MTGYCESKTGAAVRQALYEDEWPASYPSGHSLDVGQVVAIESVVVLGATVTPYTGRVELEQGARKAICISRTVGHLAGCASAISLGWTCRPTPACCPGCCLRPKQRSPIGGYW